MKDEPRFHLTVEDETETEKEKEQY